MERRSFLASLALLGVDLAALAPASSGQAGSAGERTLTVGAALLRDLDLTTAAYERMRHRVPGRHLMRQVIGHIELTEDVLRGSLWPTQKQRLLANLAPGILYASDGVPQASVVERICPGRAPSGGVERTRRVDALRAID